MIGARSARIAAIGIWSAFFWFVWLSGDGSRYLGERTLWVVPFGAIATALALAGLLLQLRSPDTALQPREGFGMLVLVLPILLVLAVPGAELGASAAERRVVEPAAAAQLASRGKSPLSAISYVHIMAAGFYPQPGVEPGVRVRLKGFAMRRAGTPAGLFQVVRFEINCCIADATALAVAVDPPAAVPAEDQWLVVTGPLARRGKEFIVRAETVRLIRPPKRPYLWQGVESAVPPTRHGTRPPDPLTATTTAP